MCKVSRKVSGGECKLIYRVSLFVLNCGADLALDRVIVLLALEMKLHSYHYNHMSVTRLKPIT